MATLNTVFKEVFSEGLKDEGFVKIKGRQPYIVRVVNGEILHIITCRNEWIGKEGYKAFEIFGEVASIYRGSLDLTNSPNQNLGMLDPIYKIWGDANPFDDTYIKTLFKFPYRKEDDDSLYQAMEHALEATKKAILPVFDKICDLDALIDYEIPVIPEEYIEGRFEVELWNRSNEGLLYIQTDNHDDLKRQFERWLRETIVLIEHGKHPFNRTVEESRENLEKLRLKIITARDKIYQNPDLHKRTLEELQKRKERNLAGLRACGLKV